MASSRVGYLSSTTLCIGEDYYLVNPDKLQDMLEALTGKAYDYWVDKRYKCLHNIPKQPVEVTELKLEQEQGRKLVLTINENKLVLSAKQLVEIIKGAGKCL